MTNSELMLAAITNGDESDTTVSAALDAIREEKNSKYLDAVLNVAAAVFAARTSRDIAEARKHVAPNSPVRDELNRSIRAECPHLPPGWSFSLIIVDGDRWPSSSRQEVSLSNGASVAYLVSVGALWVKREANRIMLDRQQARLNRRRRRPR